MKVLAHSSRISASARARSIGAALPASGAANYFAKDDYYTVEDSSEVSLWAGERATQLGIKSPEGLREITKRSRDPKLGVEDRAALKKDWVDRAAALGFDGRALVEAAEARSAFAPTDGIFEKGYRAIADAIDAARQRLGGLLRARDPLVDTGLVRAVSSPDAARTQLAVASAVRILGEREAAWPIHMLAKTALDLGLKGVTIDGVERRIEMLIDRRQLILGVSSAADRTGRMVTTREALQTEEKILAAVEKGRGLASPILSAEVAASRLQEAAERPLNPGQLAAATMILSSPDRSVLVQGVAGAGKSTMLQAVARIAEAEGRPITGLAFQNKMVADLGEGAEIKAQTIASFVLTNERFIAEQGTERHAAACETFAGSMLVVDETSMVSSSDMLKIHNIADALGVDKLVLVGDRQQLSSIDAGKAFAMIQAGGGTMARMDTNIRQRTDELRTVAALANIGKAGAALAVLGDNVIEEADPVSAAADLWLALPGKEREVTAIFASGRDARAVINERIQEGLVAEGSVKGDAYRVTVYERINTTREELRHVSAYRAGQTLEVGAGGARDVGIPAGRYDVVKILRGGKVELADGRKRFRFDPLKLSPTERRDRLQLAEKKPLVLREGDRIRWTANDKERGLFNSALARIASVETGAIVVETADCQHLRLAPDDPMLSRLDLAYSLNMHMAQGITTDKAITVMSSHERNLSNQRLFNVGVTRVRDALTMIVDDKEKLSRQLDMNPGNKTSALETLGRIDIDGRGSTAPASPFDPGPIDGLGLPDLPADGGDLPPLPAATADGLAKGETPDAPDKSGRGDTLPPLPERSLGLDL